MRRKWQHILMPGLSHWSDSVANMSQLFSHLADILIQNDSQQPTRAHPHLARWPSGNQRANTNRMSVSSHNTANKQCLTTSEKLTSATNKICHPMDTSGPFDWLVTVQAPSLIGCFWMSVPGSLPPGWFNVYLSHRSDYGSTRTHTHTLPLICIGVMTRLSLCNTCKRVGKLSLQDQCDTGASVRQDAAADVVAWKYSSPELHSNVVPCSSTCSLLLYKFV